MAWDNTKPAASSLLSSAELRNNWDALQASLFGTNWVADPNFYIWSQETANGAAAQTSPPDHWKLTGTGATLQRCGSGLTDTSDAGTSGWAAELTYGSATAYLSQDLLDAIPTAMVGQAVSAGAWVKSSTSSAARLYLWDAVAGYTYSDYHTGGGAWEWLTVEEFTVAGSVALSFGLELSSGTAHLQGSTVLLGAIPPLYSLPAPSILGTWTHTSAGVPGAGYVNPGRVQFVRPVLIVAASVAGSVDAASGVSALRVSNNGSTWVDAVNWGSHSDNYTPGVVSSTYADRCVRATGGLVAGTIGGAIAYVTSGTYTDPIWQARGLQFVRPQEALASFNDPTKFGA